MGVYYIFSLLCCSIWYLWRVSVWICCEIIWTASLLHEQNRLNQQQNFRVSFKLQYNPPPKILKHLLHRGRAQCLTICLSSLTERHFFFVRSDDNPVCWLMGTVSGKLLLLNFLNVVFHCKQTEISEAGTLCQNLATKITNYLPGKM